MTYRCAQRVGQAGEGRGARATFVREPQVAVPGWGAQAERLRQTDEDLAEHGKSEDAAIRFGAGIAQPVADEQEGGGGDDGWFGAAFVQDPDNEAMRVRERAISGIVRLLSLWVCYSRASGAESKEVSGAQPVDSALGDLEILRGGG